MTNEGSTFRICIVSHTGYGAITGATSGLIGGVEWQTSMLAKWLSARGHAVSFLAWDEGGPPEESHEGVRVIKICKRRAGVKGIRFFHPKWTALNKALCRADADVYYQNGAECVTGQVALWCRRHGRPFVFSLASDADCERRPPVMSSHAEHFLYRYGVRHADRRITQTETQRERLMANLGCDATTIPMPCPGPSSWHAAEAPLPSEFRVLWIAGVRKVKRPDRLIEVASACPEFRFDFVGPFYPTTYSREIESAVRKCPNVTAHGRVPHADVASFYHAASSMLCTSDYEGFPNTFLEAWSYGLPIVSTFDPDGLIQREHLGLVADDVPGLIAALRRVASTPDLYGAMAAKARQYFERNHRVENVMPRFEELLMHAATDRIQHGTASATAPREME